MLAHRAARKPGGRAPAATRAVLEGMTPMRVMPHPQREVCRRIDQASRTRTPTRASAMTASAHHHPNAGPRTKPSKAPRASAAATAVRTPSARRAALPSCAAVRRLATSQRRQDNRRRNRNSHSQSGGVWGVMGCECADGRDAEIDADDKQGDGDEATGAALQRFASVRFLAFGVEAMKEDHGCCPVRDRVQAVASQREPADDDPDCDCGQASKKTPSDGHLREADGPMQVYPTADGASIQRGPRERISG